MNTKMLNTGVGKWLANFALQAAAVNAALLLMARAGLLRAAAAMIGLITNMKATIAELRILITTSVAARLAIISIGGAVVLGALGALMAKIEQVNNKMLQLASSARSAEGAIRSMSQTEAVAAGKKYQYNLSLLKRLEARGGPGGAGMAQASAEEINALAETGLTPGVSFTAPFDEKTGKYGAGFYDPTMVQSAIQRTQQLGGEARARVEALNRPSPSVELETIDLSGGEGAGAGKGSKAAKEIRDISANRLELSKKLFAAQEAENQVAIVNLQTALSVLDAEENIEGVNERQRAILEAFSKRRLDLKKIAEDDAKEQERADEEKRRRQEEINRAQQEYNALLIDAQEATGAISPDEASQRRRDAEQLQTIERLRGILSPGEIENLKLAFEAIPRVGSIGEVMVALKQDFEELTNPVNMLMTSAQGIGDAFADAFSSIITGASSARESLGQFFGNVGKMFADMAARMISQWLVMKAVGLVGSLFPGSSPTPGGSGGSGIPFRANLGADAGSYRPIGIPLTPYAEYANGGIVTGPTLGLVGEGRYNEAIVPLPDGKSIPVELGGDAKNIVSNITVNVSNGQARSEGNGKANDLGRKLEGAVKQVIIEELRPGGVLAGKR